MELEPEHRRGHETARGRDRKACSQLRRERVALERPHEARHEQEDRRDGRERELEAGVEEDVRVPRQQHQHAEQQEVPAVRLSREEPRHRAERSGDRRSDDRRLRPHGEHVGGDRAERADLAEPARKAEQPREHDRARGDECHVLSGNREQVIEARGAEAVAQLLRERLLVAEDDAFDHAAALAVKAGRDRRREPRAQPVGDAREPAAVADQPPAIRAQDDMHAVAREPGAFVEPVLRRLRQANRRDRPRARLPGAASDPAAARATRARPTATTRSGARERGRAAGTASGEPARSRRAPSARPCRRGQEGRFGRARRAARCPTTSRRGRALRR